MYPEHANESGLFQELARKKDVKFGQLSYLVIKPGHTRGNHYHKRKEEWFCCLHGKCELDATNIKNNKNRKVILEEISRGFVKVDVFENHSLTNLSETKDCEILIIANEEFDKNDPDTYRIEGDEK